MKTENKDTQESMEIYVDDIIHGLEALDFNSEEARKLVREAISLALSAERKRLIAEVVALSDKIEGENSTEFNEWRAFKCLRNNLRDKYIINK